MREGDWPLPAEPLDPELVRYLDYPLYFPDDSVHCDRTDCPHELCREGSPVYLASARRMSVREFLTDIRAHAGKD